MKKLSYEEIFTEIVSEYFQRFNSKFPYIIFNKEIEKECEYLNLINYSVRLRCSSFIDSAKLFTTLGRDENVYTYRLFNFIEDPNLEVLFIWPFRITKDEFVECCSLINDLFNINLYNAGLLNGEHDFDFNELKENSSLVSDDFLIRKIKIFDDKMFIKLKEIEKFKETVEQLSSDREKLYNKLTDSGKLKYELEGKN